MSSDPPKIIIESPSSESEPLLANNSGRTYDGQVPADTENQQEEVPKRRISWLTVFFWVLGIVAFVYFVKGFIDAGDVDVSIPLTRWNNVENEAYLFIV